MNNFNEDNLEFSKKVLLNDKLFQVDVVRDENQKDLFTPKHTKYLCRILVDDKVYFTPYQCNRQHTDLDANNILYAIFMDAESYSYCINLEDFLIEYDFCNSSEEIRKGTQNYNLCKQAAEFLNSIYPNDEEYNKASEKLAEIVDDIEIDLEK